MPASRKRTPRDLRFQEYPDTMLVCRVDRHDLPPIDQPDEAQRWRFQDADVLEIRRRCRRCKSVQVRMTNEWDGELYRPTTYEYADGYLLVSTEESGPGPTPRAASRLEQTRRYLDRNPMPIKKRENRRVRA